MKRSVQKYRRNDKKPMVQIVELLSNKNHTEIELFLNVLFDSMQTDESNLVSSTTGIEHRQSRDEVLTECKDSPPNIIQH